MLASNNVYSDDVVINSSATLEVAKSLGNKLTILNADLIIDQDASMSAEDLQAVLEVVVTTTGNIQYEMASKTSTVAEFTKLSSAGNVYIDVAGDISFPALENVTTLHIGDTHTSSISSFSAPVLTKITAFGDGGSSDYSSGDVTITTGTAHQIDLPKATAITLSALATYDEGTLSVTGDAGFDFDLASITSKTAAGSSKAFNLTVDGADTLSLPLLTKGKIVTDNVDTIDLPLYVGNAADVFTDAVSITLGAYTVDLDTLGADLETIVVTGAKPEGADDADDEGPSVDLSASVDLVSATLGGVLNAVDAGFDSENKSLETFVLTGKANAVTVSNTKGFTALTLEHTADQAELASLTIVDNADLETLTVDSLVSAASLTITGNDALATISFDALKTQGGKATAVANVDISDNDLTASQSELTKVAATADDLDEGTFTSTSGMSDLETYLAAAATRFASKGGSVYASFDTLDAYLDIDDVIDPNGPFEWTEKGDESKLEVANLSAGDFVSAITVGGTKAKRSFVLDLSTADAAFQIDANGVVVDALGTPGTNAALAALSIASEANVATANAVGVAMSAAATARGTATITLGAIGSSENSPTTAAAIAQLSEGFLKSNTLTLSIDGNSYTYSTTTASVTAEAASNAIITGFNNKFSGNLAEYVLSDGGTGIINVTSADIGSDGVAKSISVSTATGGASATNVGYTINTSSVNDNKTVASTSAVLITFEASSTGSDLSEIGYPTKAMSTSAKSVKISVTVGTSTVTELSSTAFSNSNTASGVETATNKYPTESRSDVRNPHDGSTLREESGTKDEHNQIAWL